MSAEVAREKISQAAGILQEKGIDLWLTLVRESDTNPDPVLELILGTSVTWQSAFLVSAQGESVALVGSLDLAHVRERGVFGQVIGYRESLRPELLKWLAHFDPKRIAINFSKDDPLADGLSHGLFLVLREWLEGTPYIERLESAESVIAALRGRKTPAELERIRYSVRQTQEILAVVDQRIAPGMTEAEVAELIRKEMRQRGLSPAWDPEYCPSVFAGPEAAGAHAGPTERTIEPGHLVSVDFGVLAGGYASDLQRTWYFLRPGESEPPAEVRRAFAAVRDAISLAAERLRPGVEGWRVDEVARSHIVGQGFDEYPHALGHQIGRRAHDGAGLLCPRWERYGRLAYEPVEEGQVYTLEPRAVVPGFGVATIEEMVVVRNDGGEFLSARQMELFVK
ncbi:MAG: Xaa-Pro peptidase family protein [candidate division KSB1 bacterium]|nr:Xaa-Pro peptidase family protein [candidate division KSB1 bacterium]